MADQLQAGSSGFNEGMVRMSPFLQQEMAFSMIRSAAHRGSRSTLVRLLAAIAGAGLLAIQPVAAADLSGKYDPYEDPRYADIYRDPPPRYAAPRYVEPAPRYVEPPPRYIEPAPRYVEPSPGYKDDVPRDRYGRLLPFREERRYAGRHPEDAVRGHGGDRCVPRHVVRERLEREGWHDFHGAELEGAFALVNARDESGRLYVLRIERCSGEIVEARVIGGRRQGPLAWQAPRPERYRF